MREGTRKWLMWGLHLLSFILLAIILFCLASFSYLFWWVMLFLVFTYTFVSWKDEKLVDLKVIWRRRKDRIRRIWFSFLCVIFVLPALAERSTRLSTIEQEEETKKQAEYQKSYDAAPDISITLKSWTGYLGSQTGYTLVAQIQGEDEVRVNGNLVSVQKGQLEYPLELKNSETQIIISAKNKYKSASESFLVTRDKTTEELQQEKENEDKRVEEQINQLNSYITELNKWFDFYDVASINQTIQRMESINSALWSYFQDKDQRIIKKAKEVQNKLIATQNKTYPKLRNERCQLTADTMWRLDVKVKCSGTKVIFVGHQFARNANVQDSYEAVRNMLYQLRFKRVEFKWIESSYAEYTYYTIESPKDSSL